MPVITAVGHFIVEYTEHARTLGVGVLCDTAERALELVRQHHPDAVVHDLYAVYGRGRVIVDETL